MTVELATRSKVKLTVDDFDLLALNGGLVGLDRTELLDGDIHQMNAQYTRHAMAKAFFYNVILDWQRVHRSEWVVLSEVSVAMPPHDEPIPDVVLCARPTGTKGIPVETVRLLVEIADESRKRDMGYKKDLYARQAVPEYWVVDLDKRQVWRFSSPGAEGYCTEAKVPFGENFDAVTLAGLAVNTAELD